MTFLVEAVTISSRRGTQKQAVEEIRLIENWGIDGDAHAGKWHRQVSLLAGEAIDRLRAKGLQLAPGDFGENLVTRGIDWSRVSIGDRFRINDAELEITQIGKECLTPCAIFAAAGECIMPREGAFARVIKGGTIRAQCRGDHSIR